MAEESKSTAAQKEETPTYHVDRLVAEADARFGVPSHVAAGAFEGHQRKTHSEEQAQKLIDNFLKRPVEVDNPISPEQPGADEEGGEA